MGRFSLACWRMVLAGTVAAAWGAAALPPATAPGVEVAWRYVPEGQGARGADFSDACCANGAVYVGEGGKLRAVDPSNATFFWSNDIGGRIYGLQADKERVYFTSEAGLTAVTARPDQDGGKAAWQFKIENGGSYGGCALSPMDEQVFVGGDNGFVYALDRRTGAKHWERNIVEGAPPDPAGFDGGNARLGKNPARCGGIATDGKMVYQSIFDQSRVVAMDCKTGEVRWTYQTKGWIYGGSALDEGHVYVGSQDKMLYCLKNQTGEVVWKFATKGRIESTPVVQGANVLVASCDGSMYCISRATGEKVWAFACEPKTAIYSRPAIVGESLYFAAGEGQLYALTLGKGELLWKVRPLEGSELYCSPATDGVQVYVTSRAKIATRDRPASGAGGLAAVKVKGTEK